MYAAIGYGLLALAVVEFALSVLIARNLRRGPANRTAAFLAAVAGVYTLMAAFTYVAASRGHGYLLYYRLGWVAFLMLPAMMRLTLLLRDPRSRAARWVAWTLYPPWFVVWILTLTTDLFEMGSVSLIPFVDIAGPLENPARAAGLLNVLAVLALIVWVLRTTTGIVRQRMRYFLLGAVAFSAGTGVSALLLQLFGGMGFDPALGSAFSLPWVMAVAYSMGRHRLFDIRLAVSKAAAVLVILLIAVVSHLALFRLLKDPLGDTAANVVSLCGIMGVVFLTGLHRVTQRIVDDVLVRGKYDYQQILRESTRAVAAHLDLDELLEFLFQIMRRSFHVQTALLLLRDDEGKFSIRSAFGEPAGAPTAEDVGAAVMERLSADPSPLVTAEWRDETGPEADDRVSADLARLSAAVVVPLEFRGELGGLLALGEKGNGEPYSDTDIHLLESLAAQAAVAIENARLYQRATTDGLTGLAHQRHLRMRLDEEMARARRYGIPLCLVMLDIDRFKAVNDTHGHQVGDAVIRQVARALREQVRPTDIVARYGGEEFCVVLTHTALPQALAVTERLRATVDQMECAPGVRVTLSAGISSAAEGGGAEELIGRADRALYAAKRGGRDRVESSAGSRDLHALTASPDAGQAAPSAGTPLAGGPPPLAFESG